ncbi:MAG: hypothetical protein IJ357_08680 [Oscillospiraceae bacterium]|nr:hypothetical protein [Oscillospiraceae bacterium]
MKRRLITAALVLPVLLLFSALLACNLHGLFSGQVMFVWRPGDVLPLLLHVRAVQRFFLIFAGLSLLLILAAMVSSTGVQYRNAVRTIAPGIVIPEAAGRGGVRHRPLSDKTPAPAVFLPPPTQHQVSCKGGGTA